MLRSFSEEKKCSKSACITYYKEKTRSSIEENAPKVKTIQNFTIVYIFIIIDVYITVTCVYFHLVMVDKYFYAASYCNVNHTHFIYWLYCMC